MSGVSPLIAQNVPIANLAFPPVVLIELLYSMTLKANLRNPCQCECECECECVFGAKIGQILSELAPESNILAMWTQRATVRL